MGNCSTSEVPSGFVQYQVSKDLLQSNFVEERKKQASFVSDFGRDLLISVNKEKSDASIFISPLSINIALLMVSAGAAENTLLEFVNVLHLSELSSSDAILKFQGALTEGSKKDNSLSFYNVANSVWISNKFEVYGAYVDSVKQAFNSKVEVVDFSSSKLVGTINKWVSDQTNGLIKKIVDQIKQDEQMFLINTVYFNKKWAQQFKASASREGDFTLLNGQITRPMFMHASEKYPFFSNEDVDAVLLRFEVRQASLLVILPKERGNEALVQTADKYLSHEKIAALLKEARSTKLNLALPRFKMSFSLSMKESLKRLGLESSFEDSAKFMYISKKPLKISDVIHQAVLRVDENGVEAAAATVVKMRMLMGMVENDMPIPFVVNRPFVCALLDEDMTIFNGIVRDVSGGSSSDL